MSYTNTAVNPPLNSTNSTNYGLGYGNDFSLGQIDWQGNWLDQMQQGEASTLAKMPYLLGEQYNKVAQDGIYGKGGVGTIMNDVQRANLLRMRQMAKGQMMNSAQRVGPRSLGVKNSILNKVYAPGMSETASTHANLLRENMMSKMQGIQGMQQIMEFMSNRHGNEWWKKAKNHKGGVLGFIKNALKVAQFIPGPQQPFVAGANASINGGEAFSYNSGGGNNSTPGYNASSYQNIQG